MGSEDTLAAHRFHILVPDGCAAGPVRRFIQQFQSQEGGVPFIHMIARQPGAAERPQHPHPADSEHDLLTDPVVGFASIGNG